jgi:hypothetical protein
MMTPWVDGICFLYGIVCIVTDEFDCEMKLNLLSGTEIVYRV